MQCPKTECDGLEAAFFQVQIRSADEPMTGFYKVSFREFGRKKYGWIEANDMDVVHDLWYKMERELRWSQMVRNQIWVGKKYNTWVLSCEFSEALGEVEVTLRRRQISQMRHTIGSQQSYSTFGSW